MHYGQTQAGADLAHAPISLVEHRLLERNGQVVVSQSGTSVADFEDHRTCTGHLCFDLQRQHDRRAGRCHPQCVLQQTVDDLANPRRISHGERRSFRHLQAEQDSSRGTALRPDRRGCAHGGDQIRRRQIQPEVLRVQTRQIQ